MNIFILDMNFSKCAQYHVDKHVNKMITESAQILSTAHRVIDGVETIELSEKGRKKKVYQIGNDYEREEYLYKATHVNHPCSVWVRESSSNYAWLYRLYQELNNEFEYRYGKIHGAGKLLKLLANHPEKIIRAPMTPFALAMPDHYKVFGDAVESYRNYYLGEKRNLFLWKNRPTPEWVTES